MHRAAPSRAATVRAVTVSAVTAAVCVASTLTPAVAETHRRPEGGTLILVGGGLEDARIYREIIAKAGGPDRARIGVITAASVPPSQDPNAADPATCSNSACNGAYYADLFKTHGAAGAQWIPVDIEHVDAADSDAVVAQVNSMTGFFFGGGDQYRYVTSLLHGTAHTDSKVVAAIRAKLAAGAVVAGTSAGAQIASGPDMVTGGDSYQALRDGSAPGYFDDPTRLGYLPAGGFGFLASGLIDTHTGTYGREGRAVRLAADTGHDRVFALDEDTALEVENAGTRHESLRVLGNHGVSVLDLRHARASTGPGGWSIRSVGYTHLTDGDQYDPRSRRTRPAPAKRPFEPVSTAPVPANNDIFSSAADPSGTPYSFSGTARALIATTAQRTATATTWETVPGFRVTFTENPSARAYTADGATPATLTGLNIAIDPR
ncbi:cyanophycinase [Kitasatospora sp. NPDC101801]|uniref:cyanophycinase n=1 Tax=Kitasatospora sp. NPDC101801 TaxID=3364103 RepID=UPI003810D292